ncbi:UNVERIFIED_CONTAM: E3 binding domain-containing protein, partial [Escherichia coli]
MPIEKITMPKLGESVTEGTISNWIVSVGDVVNKYDPLAEVMTDKVNAEIPSSFSGKVKELIAKEGQTLEVGEVICTIEVEGDNSQDEQPTKEETEEKAAASINKDTSQKARYSPAVLRLSQEAGIDLTLLTGTGAGGRITRKDVQKAIQEGVPQGKEDEKVPANGSSVPADPIPKKETSVHNVQTQAGDKEFPITGLRKAIASNMVKSKHEIPHA